MKFPQFSFYLHCLLSKQSFAIMKSFEVLLFFGAIILVFIGTFVRSDCGVCGPNSVACHSVDTFSACFTDKPSFDYIKCPDGHICSEEHLICYNPSEGRVASCSSEVQCGVCDVTGNFACLSETSYVLCNKDNKGTAIPDVSTEGNCPPNKVCDLNNKDFCSEDVKPSCVTKATDPTTTAIPDPTTTPETTSTTASTIENICERGCPGSYIWDCTVIVECTRHGKECTGEVNDCKYGTTKNKWAGYFSPGVVGCVVNPMDGCEVA